MDCGPTSLRIIAKFYGKLYSTQYLRELSYITKQGVSMLGLSDAAESIGFRTKGVKITWDQFKNEVPLPCIIHWDEGHFLVVYDIKKKKNDSKSIIYVSDPAYGLIEHKRDEFLNNWVGKLESKKFGHALLLEPTPEFYKEDGEELERTKITYLFRYLRPYKSFIVQLFLGMLVSSLLSLIAPFLAQANMDLGILNDNYSFVILVTLSQLMLAVAQTANGMIRNWIMLHVTSRVSIALISDFFIKLMKLPISYFDTKLTGDIMQRIEDHNRIQSFLTGNAIYFIFSIFTLIIYSFMMAAYHFGILGIFYIGSLLYTGWILLFMKKRKELDYRNFTQAAKNNSSIIQIIHGMQEIKLNGCEKQKRWEWERIRAKLFQIDIKRLNLSQNQEIGAFFINRSKTIFISLLTAKAVIEGQMTLGMLMAIGYIIGNLEAPIQVFIEFIKSLQDTKIGLERIGEIHNLGNEDAVEIKRINKIPINDDIIIDNLTFGYEGPNCPKVFENLNLVIPKNKTTAIVGTSGSGKTTLLKLLLGFYNLHNGQILINNVPLNKLNQRNWRLNCGVVMQEGFIFSDTIENNIGIIDEIPEFERIKVAAETACIDEFIDSLPLGYNTKIGSDGVGLSTGQKQRLLIARAVYKDAPFMFFDEATNALDSTNETLILNNLNDFFQDRTTIIVAHRLSTVKRADKIVVLEKGIIIEEGKHDDLIKLKGMYYQLVKDQLELNG